LCLRLTLRGIYYPLCFFIPLAPSVAVRLISFVRAEVRDSQMPARSQLWTSIWTCNDPGYFIIRGAGVYRRSPLFVCLSMLGLPCTLSVVISVKKISILLFSSPIICHRLIPIVGKDTTIAKKYLPLLFFATFSCARGMSSK